MEDLVLKEKKENQMENFLCQDLKDPLEFQAQW